MSKHRHDYGRSINGIIVVNKQHGPSSNNILQRVKRLYGAAKAGQTGSLDPLATGVLPICLGEATKFAKFLLESDKSYRTEVILGVKTKTGDKEGVVLEKRIVKVIQSDIEVVLERFRGTITQVPSMYSALKHNGKSLYKLARQGMVVERLPRRIIIYRLDIFDFVDNCLILDVDCSKGTYIRTLVEDIGDTLGCLGHVAKLHRIQAGPYHESQSYTLKQLEKIYDEGGREALDMLLLPLDSTVSKLPKIYLKTTSSYCISQGQSVQIPQVLISGDVRIYGQRKNNKVNGFYFLGVGKVDNNGQLFPKRLICQIL